MLDISLCHCLLKFGNPCLESIASWARPWNLLVISSYSGAIVARLESLTLFLGWLAQGIGSWASRWFR
jgi:hypothetical protein